MKTFLLYFLFFISQVNAQEIPELNVPVIDLVNVLDLNQKGSLDTKIIQLSEDEKVEMAILIIPKLENISLDDFKNKVVSKWEIDPDNGVLLLLSMEDGSYSMHLGKVLNRKIPFLVKKKLMDKMNAFLSKGEFYEALNYNVLFFDQMLMSKDQKAVQNKSNESFFIKFSILSGLLLGLNLIYIFFFKKRL